MEQGRLASLEAEVEGLRLEFKHAQGLQEAMNRLWEVCNYWVPPPDKEPKKRRLWLEGQLEKIYGQLEALGIKPLQTLWSRSQTYYRGFETDTDFRLPVAPPGCRIVLAQAGVKYEVTLTRWNELRKVRQRLARLELHRRA